jgi:hypothetical protein
MLSEIELASAKPCPFCFEKELGVSIIAHCEECFEVAVICQNCDCSGPYVQVIGKENINHHALTAWNTRGKQ